MLQNMNRNDDLPHKKRKLVLATLVPEKRIHHSISGTTQQRIEQARSSIFKNPILLNDLDKAVNQYKEAIAARYTIELKKKDAIIIEDNMKKDLISIITKINKQNNPT